MNTGKKYMKLGDGIFAVQLPKCSHMSDPAKAAENRSIGTGMPASYLPQQFPVNTIAQPLSQVYPSNGWTALNSAMSMLDCHRGVVPGTFCSCEGLPSGSSYRELCGIEKYQMHLLWY